MNPDENRTPSDAAPSVHGALFRMSVRSFRAFREEASVDVCPLTLLYGHNQAGKSSLLRLVALIADSLQPRATALDLLSPALRGATFKELGWMGRDPALTPWLTLRSPSKGAEPTLVLQFADDGGLVVNQVKLIQGEAGDKFVVSLDGDVERDQDRIRASYAGKYRGSDWTGALTFASLIPDGLPEQAAEIARAVLAALAPVIRAQWLHANRLTDHGIETRPTRCCRADGSDLASALREPRHRAVLEAASAWIARQSGLGSDVRVHLDNAGHPRFSLGHPGREHLPLHLAGEGVRALLPVLLCACWAELGRRGGDANAPTLLAVEEPEAHLHPDLQVALFRRLVDSVRAGVPVILETHSVYVLRAMQLAVLEGLLTPADVGLYWVGQDNGGAASVTRAEIRADATLSGWRPLAFEQEQELAHQLLDLRWKRLATS